MNDYGEVLDDQVTEFDISSYILRIEDDDTGWYEDEFDENLIKLIGDL